MYPHKIYKEYRKEDYDGGADVIGAERAREDGGRIESRGARAWDREIGDTANEASVVLDGAERDAEEGGS